jgi:hypothetical protein
MNSIALSAGVMGLAIISNQAAIFTVTTADNFCPRTLRQAILEINATTGGNTIAFTTTGTIRFTSALPPVSQSLDIEQPGADARVTSWCQIQRLVECRAVCGRSASSERDIEPKCR